MQIVSRNKEIQKHSRICLKGLFILFLRQVIEVKGPENEDLALKDGQKRTKKAINIIQKV